MRASGLAEDLGVRADSQDALALDGHSLGARLSRGHGDHASAVEDESGSQGNLLTAELSSLR